MTQSYLLVMSRLLAVLFDVDFTIAKPGPDLEMRRRDDAGVGARVQLRHLRGRAAGPRRPEGARAQARPRLEHGPRPRGVRPAPRSRRRRGGQLRCAWEDQAASDDLPGGA